MKRKSRMGARQIFGGLFAVFALIVGLVVAPTAAADRAAAAPGQAAPGHPAQPSKFLLVAGIDVGQIAVMRVHDNGRLSLLRHYPTGRMSMSLKVAQDGRTVYVSHVADSAITVYRLSDTGVLRPIQKFSTPMPPVTVVPSVDSKYLFAAMGMGKVATYRITPSGALARTGLAAEQLGGTIAPMVTVDPNGKFVRVTSAFENAVKSYRIGPGGKLLPIGRVSTGMTPVNGMTTPDNRFFYVAHEDTFNVIGYRILPSGNLVQIGNWYTGPITHEARVSPDGKWLYAPAVGGGGVTVFRILGNGQLAKLKGSPFNPGGPISTSTLVVPNPRLPFVYAVDTLSPGQGGGTHVKTMRVLPNGALKAVASTDMGLNTIDGPVAALAG
ncbi:beta-propeller fold lactonase family protein [Gordonia sp. X0973]|uniref:lactonase family protein n=1 Tax=Gordonia sp. X0973 TaxID=2742602 RepID=UPI000F520BA8|nr:beta-propeller fold lactonase family protein [Gordonia sp. X0973]QKT08794.1 beta-propeller fold lactonase family protein [Gordonia sp. X0973]